MNAKTNAEKEWLRKMTTGRVVERPAPKQRNGFGDVVQINICFSMIL